MLRVLLRASLGLISAPLLVAEKAVVDANDSSTFMTGILRPGGIYGPRDRLVVKEVRSSSTHAIAGPGFV
jgi:nucleoside-diphosphate-sugar epimerase